MTNSQKIDIFHKKWEKGTSRESLLKGKFRYSWPPCTTQFISAAFDFENIMYLFTKQADLMRRLIVLSFPLQLVFLGTSNRSWSLKGIDLFGTSLKNRL